MEDRLVVVFDSRMCVLVEISFIDDLGYTLMCEIWIDGTGTKAKDRRKLMNISRLCRLENKGNRSPLLCKHQMLFNGAHSKQRRDGNVVFINSPVTEDDNVATSLIGTVHSDI